MLKKYKVRGVAMSITNSITKLLNMEDNNLNFNENFLEERKINELGFVADTVIYNDSNLLKKGQSILDIAQIINDQFINFNYDDIMNRLSMFSKGAKKEIGPIKIRK